MAGTIFMIIIILLIVYIVTSCVRIVPQAQAYVIERLGAYNGTWSGGMHFKVPFIDRVAKKVLLKEQVVDFLRLFFAFLASYPKPEPNDKLFSV